MTATLRHRSGDLIEDRYEVQKRLGAGAFGTVYACRDTELDILVAIKELHVLDDPRSPGPREAALKQFRAEAQHLSRLRHPHIVSGHYEPHAGSWRICPVCGLDFPTSSRCPEHNVSLFALKSRHYLVMEYIEGPDLLEAAHQNGGHLRLQDALLWLEQTASALAHVHAKGFVHRDIKPENIRLRDGQSEAVLLDFGIAAQGVEQSGGQYGTQVQRHTQGGGTFGYAPESPSERRAPDARSDVHALGMTLYHLLTGQDPTEPDVLREMREGDPAFFNLQILPSLNDLIRRSIDLNPEKRPQDGGEFLAELQNLEEVPVPLAAVVAPPAEPKPTAIFQFRTGQIAHDAPELAQLLDSHWNESARYLMSGEFEKWLFALGEHELATRAREIRARYRAKPHQALEAFAQALGLPRPQLDMATDELNFGSLAPDAQKKTAMHLQNHGRGHLFGLIRVSHPAIQTFGEWDGNRAKIPVAFDAMRLAPGDYSGEIALDSSAGQHAIGWRAHVRGPSWIRPFLTVLMWGVLGLLAGAALRAGPFVLWNWAGAFLSWFANGATVAPLAGRSGWNWFEAQNSLSWWPVAPLFGLVFWATWCILSVVESSKRDGCWFWILSGLMGVFLAIGAGVLGNEILLAGDVFLRPLTQNFVHKFAPGGWMLAGTAIGALWGTLARPHDILSIRSLAILVGWAAAFAVCGAAIAGALSK